MRRLLSLALLGVLATGSLALGPGDTTPADDPDPIPTIVPEPPFTPFPLGACVKLPVDGDHRYCAIIPDPR